MPNNQCIFNVYFLHNLQKIINILNQELYSAPKARNFLLNYCVYTAKGIKKGRRTLAVIRPYIYLWKTFLVRRNYKLLFKPNAIRKNVTYWVWNYCKFSIKIDEAPPPPLQIAATPYFPFLRFKTFISAIIILAPEALSI